MDIPTLAGIGAGFGLLQQAPKLSDVTANATSAAILTNFMNNFPLLSLRVAGAIKTNRGGETMKFAVRDL